MFTVYFFTFASDLKKNEVQGLYGGSDEDRLKFHALVPDLETKGFNDLDDAKRFASELPRNIMFFCLTDANYNYIRRSPDCVAMCELYHPIKQAQKMLFEINKCLQSN